MEEIPSFALKDGMLKWEQCSFGWRTKPMLPVDGECSTEFHGFTSHEPTLAQLMELSRPAESLLEGSSPVTTVVSDFDDGRNEVIVSGKPVNEAIISRTDTRSQVLEVPLSFPHSPHAL